MQQRPAKAIGAEDKKKAYLKEPFEGYVRAKAAADAGRMQRKLVEAKSDDSNMVSHAIDSFSGTGDSRLLAVAGTEYLIPHCFPSTPCLIVPVMG